MPRDVAREDPARPEPEAEGANPRAWPYPTELHPLVRDFPADQEESLESVARTIKAGAPDPRARLEALHDWIADRIAYDAVALEEDNIPRQDAKSVFATRRAVCAGYANLFKAMAEVTGDEVVVVVGDARTDVDEIGGGGHAWNAAKLEGQWTLIDATWDAGHVKGRVFTKRYSTNYLMTPAEIFGVDHFPAEERWQLRERPLSRGDFMRQPMLRAQFFTHGSRLRRPTRSQVTVSSTFEASFDNPRNAFVLAQLSEKGASGRDFQERCTVSLGPRVDIGCKLPRDGVYRVQLFAGREKFGRYQHAGTFEAVSRR